MVNPRRPRRARRTVRLALLPVAAGLALGLGGCSVTNPMTTQANYAASDGVRVEVGDVTVINLLVLSAEEGGPGTVLGAVSNHGDDRVGVTISLTDGERGSSLRVPAGGSVRLGPDQDETIELDQVPVAPGALLDVQISSDQGGSTVVRVPVLDGTLPEYADLVP